VLVHLPLPYLARNKVIVHHTEMMVAAPNGRVERLRSGTWSTVRFAKEKMKRIVWLFYPDGTIDSNAPYLHEMKPTGDHDA
jgi:hypothetical protein